MNLNGWFHVSSSDFCSEVMYQENFFQAVKAPKESFFEFEYHRNGSSFINRTIKREIGTLPFHGKIEKYFDLESRYGYGGWFIDSSDTDFIREAISKYKAHCSEANIIAEFIRFNPIYEINSLLPSNLDFFAEDRLTVNIDLKKSYSEINKRYSQTTRNQLRKKSKFLFQDEISPEKFYDIYNKTMERNSAKQEYFLTSGYIKELLRSVDSNIYGAFLGVELVSAALVLFSNKNAYYHLAGNSFSSESRNANLELIDFICRELKTTRPQLETFHLGGGRTQLEDDPLLSFKSKFSKQTAQYYVGGVIFEREIYDSLMKNALSGTGTSRFLNYRSDLA